MNLYRDDFRCQYSKSDGGCHPGSCMSVRSGVFLRPKMASCADFKFGRLNRIGGERLPQTDSLRYREAFLWPEMASCADFKFGRLNRIGGERLPQTDSLRYRDTPRLYFFI